MEKISRIESIARMSRHWINRGFSLRAVFVFFHKEHRTEKENKVIIRCMNTEEALTKLQILQGGVK